MAEEFKFEIEQYEIALEECESTKAKVRPQKPRPNPMFNNRTIFEHVLLHLKAIRNSEIENALRFLNFKQSMQLFYYLENYIRNNIDLEIASRCVLFILDTYQPQIQMTLDMEPVLKSIAVHMRYHFKDRRDMIGINQAALKLLEKEVTSVISGGKISSFAEFRAPFSF